MALQDFGIEPDRMSVGVQRALFRASEEARRRQHETIAVEHVLYGLCITEWGTFANLLREIHLDPNELLTALEQSLEHFPELDGGGHDALPDTHVCNVIVLATHIARRGERKHIEPMDLFAVIFHDFAHLVGYLFEDPALAIALDHAIVRWVSTHNQQQIAADHFILPPALKSFATNLNLAAVQGRINPVTGRTKELRQMMEVLCHRDRPNSVMITGEPGVGKTSLVETLAWYIEKSPMDVPVRLRNCQVLNMAMNAVVAGTTLRGQFEERIQNIIAEIQKNPHFILFIDEAHLIVGAGSALGTQADAANIFKSVLTRGDVRIIGATTLDEYKAFIADDEALARRFRVVSIPEPTIAETRHILEQSVVPRLETNYNVTISSAAVDTALQLSSRYQRHLHLPDKVIGWLDTAAVRSEIDQESVVTAAHVMAVISDTSSIPLDMITKDQQSHLTQMEWQLAHRVVGQDAAIRAVAERIILNKGPLKENHQRPDGVLLFLGPTGVGKTELAKATAEFLFGTEKKMIRIDMSEYQGGGVDKLIGQPRGIVDSDRGGILTNQLRDNPCSVVLLDEIEKAHPSVLNLFLQAFDEGWITDGRGKRVYLSDAIVIMTSNIGAEHFKALTNPFGFATGPTTARNVTANIWKEYEKRLSPEFRNRIDKVILFDPLTEDEVRRITEHYIDNIKATVIEAGKSIVIDLDVVDHLAQSGFNPSYGARFLKRTIDEQLRIPLSHAWPTSQAFTVVLDNGIVEIIPQIDKAKKKV